MGSDLSRTSAIILIKNRPAQNLAFLKLYVGFMLFGFHSNLLRQLSSFHIGGNCSLKQVNDLPAVTGPVASQGCWHMEKTSSYISRNKNTVCLVKLLVESIQ